MLSQRDRLREKIRAECLRQIKRLNACFRKLKKRDGPMFDRMATRKNALINIVQANCSHSQAFQGDGGTRRICCVCGWIERRFHGRFDKLESADAIKLEDKAYLVEMRKLCKKLGLDL